MTKGELLFEIVLVFVYIDLSVWSAHKPRNVKRFTASVRNHEMLLASYDIRQHKSHSLLVRSVTHGQGSLASSSNERCVGLPFALFFNVGVQFGITPKREWRNSTNGASGSPSIW